MMLEWGLQKADEEGAPFYLEGTMAGKSLYEKLGFVVAEETEIPGIHQVGQPYMILFMLRAPVS